MTTQPASSPERARLDPSAIRRYRPSDEAEFLEVVVAGYEGWPWFQLPVPVSEHLKWRMDGHRPSDNRHWVVELDGRVVSTTLEAELEVRVGGVTKTLSIQGGVATLPEYQGRGVWSGLWNFRVENQRPKYDFTLTVSTNPIILRGWARDTNPRLHMENDIRVLMKVLDVRRAALIHEEAGGRFQQNVVTRFAAFAGLRLWGMLQSRPRRVKKTWNLKKVEQFDDRIDRFFEEASQPFDFIFERSSEFLNWRYCDPRGGNHTVFLAEENGLILGYTVVRTSSETRGQILDLLVLPGRQDVADSLLKEAIAFLRAQGVASIHCWTLSHHVYNKVLRRHGFVDSRRKINFGWWMRPGGDNSYTDFLKSPTAAVHVMEGDVLD